MEIRKAIGVYGIVHIRRGDSLDEYTRYQGFSANRIKESTTVENIKRHIIKLRAKYPNVPVLLMTNEKSHGYLSNLKKIENVIEETDLLKKFGDFNDDNTEHFQIMRTLGDFAAFRICTVMCYFKRCDTSLVSGKCRKKNRYCK